MFYLFIIDFTLLKTYSNQGLCSSECEEKFNDSVTFKIGDRIFSPYEEILKDKDISNVLIQSNDDLPHLRKMLSIWGYKITREEVIYDNKYYYVFIKAIRGNISYTKEQLLLGPLLMLDPSNQIYIMYLNHLSKKYIKMINNVPKEFISEKEELLNNSKIIDNYLYNCTKK